MSNLNKNLLNNLRRSSILSRSQFRASKQLTGRCSELTVVVPRKTTSGRQPTNTRSRTESRSTIKSRYYITYSAQPTSDSNARHYINEQRCRGGVERRNWSTSHCRQLVTPYYVRADKGRQTRGGSTRLIPAPRAVVPDCGGSTEREQRALASTTAVVPTPLACVTIFNNVDDLNRMI